MADKLASLLHDQGVEAASVCLPDWKIEVKRQDSVEDVTPDWLVSLGFEWRVGFSLEKRRPPPLEHIGVRVTETFGSLWLIYGDGSSCLNDNPTRNDVLKLCSALGVPVKESRFP